MNSFRDSTGEMPSLRVSQAIGLCNTIFEEMELRVEGEVANYSLSRGKFIFFDLKDEDIDARLSCFMMAYQSPFPLENGMRVVVTGRPGLYQKSGQFRISVSAVAAKGEGSLKRAFELLKAKLQQEGLFAQERKRLLPRYVGSVGIISSIEAAGYGDFCTIAFQRLPGVRYTVVHVAVQGQSAEDEICRAFEQLNEVASLDAIVLIRGGGSAEDLHAFNSEAVARAIVRSRFPVVVGVGHERDITIADFVADVRAATPSNAAQLLLPTREEIAERVRSLTQRGQRSVENQAQRLQSLVLARVGRVGQAVRYHIHFSQAKVEERLKTIAALSPQRTLERGYSITTDPNGKVVVANGLKTGDLVKTQVADGAFHSTITSLE